MLKNGNIWFAQSEKDIFLLPSMANRHGLIAGATGTGKTITLKVLAEAFSEMGVPVFLSDVKGDLSGMCSAGEDSENMRSRIARFGIEGWQYQSYPTRFWDIYGEGGSPVRVTITDMGPVLLSRLLGLTEVQQGVLDITFRVADDNGLKLLDLKDLRAMLQYVGDNRAEFTLSYGNISTASVGAIQRALLRLEDEGGNLFFGEPALDIRDWMRSDASGKGYINVLNSVKLSQNPTIYSTFLLWMLTELFEVLPEVGDLDKPRLVFFFDEAHMLFTNTSKALLQKITQVVKLIRSKGVGVYFVTQNPTDIPDEVLAQLSNRVQHALRAYTPTEQKAVRAAAGAFRANPAFDTAAEITNLAVGEALISCLDENGIPSVVEKAKVLPPKSLMGPADSSRIEKLITADEFELKYRESVDRESAYEILVAAAEELKKQLEEAAEAEALAKQQEAEAKALAKQEEAEAKALAKQEAAEAKAAAKSSSKSGSKKQNAVSKTLQKATTSAASSVSRSVSTNIVNSIAGGKKVSGATMAKRAATNALSSVMRSGTTAIVRGLFGIGKK